MKNSFILFFIVLGLALLTSCSIEKRIYRPGFYVEKNSFKSSKKTYDAENYAIIEKKEQSHRSSNQETSSTLDITETITYKNQPETALEPLYAFHSKSAKLDKINLTNTVSQKYLVKNIIQENKQAWEVYYAKSKAKSGKSQIIAILLCFFLGFLGIHSFYIGKKSKGLIQLLMFLGGILTFWLFIGYIALIALGIWVFVDFIRLIIGDIGPGW